MNLCKPLIKTLLLLFLFASSHLFAQPSFSPQKIKIAVLCPLYLDSAFNDYTYQLGNNNMPQYILSGLDFYNGVMLAVDSLKKEHMNAEVWIYDTKKKNTDINNILQGMKALNFSLIVASFTANAEQKAVSAFSFANNIPVVSVTYPNDAGLSANPYFVMLNSTLKTHINGIYNYVQQNYPFSKTIFITKNTSLESRIANDFKANDSLIKNHFAYKTLDLNNDVNWVDIQPYLDSNRQNLIVCGSLNNDFASSIVKMLGNNPSYKTTLIGMPNWDGMKKLYHNNFNNVDIVYSTPFNYDAGDSVVQSIASAYRSKFDARPSDIVYKGFEAMYHYTHLVADFTNEFPAHVSDTTYRIANDFFVEPEMMNATSLVPDYLENKNLYFIKKNKGDIVSVTQLKKK